MKTPEWLKRDGKLPIGPPEDFTPGSKDWAKAISISILATWGYQESTKEQWEREISIAKKHHVAKTLGFNSFDEYLQALINKNEQESLEKFVDGTRKAEYNGGDRRSGQYEIQYNNIILKQGTSKKYLLSRIKRDNPKMVERIRNGDMSVHAAAVEAGIVKPTASVPKSKEGFVAYIKRTFTPAEIRWIKEQL